MDDLALSRPVHTCPVVEVELVGVGTVEAVEDLAISARVWILS